MRVPLKQLLDNLGVGEILSPYETCPWSAYDGEKECTCSAEVRMSPDGDEIEAELQMMYDTPPEGKLPIEQIIHILCKPANEKWDVTKVFLSLEDPKADPLYDREGKAVKFFEACVQELKMGTVPDVDELFKTHMKNTESFSGGRGGGSKSPRMKPMNKPGMKGGGSI